MIGAIAKALLGDTLDTVIDRVVPDVKLRKVEGLGQASQRRDEGILG